MFSISDFTSSYSPSNNNPHSNNNNNSTGERDGTGTGTTSGERGRVDVIRLLNRVLGNGVSSSSQNQNQNSQNNNSNNTGSTNNGSTNNGSIGNVLTTTSGSESGSGGTCTNIPSALQIRSIDTQMDSLSKIHSHILGQLGEAVSDLRGVVGEYLTTSSRRTSSRSTSVNVNMGTGNRGGGSKGFLDRLSGVEGDVGFVDRLLSSSTSTNNNQITNNPIHTHTNNTHIQIQNTTSPIQSTTGTTNNTNNNNQITQMEVVDALRLLDTQRERAIECRLLLSIYFDVLSYFLTLNPNNTNQSLNSIDGNDDERGGGGVSGVGLRLDNIRNTTTTSSNNSSGKGECGRILKMLLGMSREMMADFTTTTSSSSSNQNNAPQTQNPNQNNTNNSQPQNPTSNNDDPPISSSSAMSPSANSSSTSPVSLTQAFSKTTSFLETYLACLHRECIQDFEGAYKDSDLVGMKCVVDILKQFSNNEDSSNDDVGAGESGGFNGGNGNGGGGCVGVWVGYHEFFRRHAHIRHLHHIQQTQHLQNSQHMNNSGNLNNSSSNGNDENDGTGMMVFPAFLSDFTASTSTASSKSDSHSDSYNEELLPEEFKRVLTDILETISAELTTISAIFPRPIVVILHFVRRMFTHVLKDSVEAVLDRAGNAGKGGADGYVEALCALYRLTGSLIRSISQVVSEHLDNNSDIDGNNINSNSDESGNRLDMEFLEARLKRIHQDLFIDHLDPTSSTTTSTNPTTSATKANGPPLSEKTTYTSLEMRLATHAHSLALKPHTDFVEHRKACFRNRSVFSKMGGSQISSIATSLSSSSVPNTNNSNGNNIGNNSNWSGSATGADLTGGYHAGMTPNGETIQVLLSIHRRIIYRMHILISPPSDLAKHIAILYERLLDAVCGQWMESCLDIAVENMLADSQNGAGSKTEPDLRYLECVAGCNLVVHAVHALFIDDIVPLISAHPAIYRQLVAKKNDCVGVVEQKVNAIVNKTVGWIIEWSAQILGRQKKFDYRPRENEVVTMATLTSSPCARCCDYLKKTHAQMKQWLDGGNFDCVMSEIGELFHRFLLDHVKKFTINTNGGLLLAKDLVKYQETVVNQLRIESVAERFEALRQLGTVYIVKPEYLKTLIDESEMISRMDPAVLHEYISKRDDYKSARLDLLFDHSSSSFAVSPTSNSVNNGMGARWEGAVDALGGTIEEVSESLKKMINL